MTFIYSPAQIGVQLELLVVAIVILHQLILLLLLLSDTLLRHLYSNFFNLVGH